MSMTKKERAEFDALIKECQILGALRWSGYSDTPDVPVPESGTVTGWYSHAYLGSLGKLPGNIGHGWTTSVSHGDGVPDRPYRFGSQGARAMYSTRLIALKALRAKIERQCAEVLRNVDLAIAEEANRGES